MREQFHEDYTWNNLPIIWEPGYSPVYVSRLTAIKDRFDDAIDKCGVNTTLSRFDFKADTRREDIISLLTYYQRKAKRNGSKFHYIYAIEQKGAQGNHYHAFAIYDSSILKIHRYDDNLTNDNSDFLGNQWKKRTGGVELLCLRGNDGKKWHFRIGQSKDEYLEAFRACSYLAKSSQPAILKRGENNFVSSNLKFLESFDLDECSKITIDTRTQICCMSRIKNKLPGINQSYVQ